MKTHVLMMGLAAISSAVLIAILACGGSEAKPAVTGTPEPAAAAQCGRDSDCKGDRICDRGQCVSPR